MFSVNGNEIGRQTDGKLWYTPTPIVGVDRTGLVSGKNVIEVAAENNRGIAAFIAAIEVSYKDSRIVRFTSGERGWKASVDGKIFDEPSVVGRYGCAPYGKFGEKK